MAGTPDKYRSITGARRTEVLISVPLPPLGAGELFRPSVTPLLETENRFLCEDGSRERPVFAARTFHSLGERIQREAEYNGSCFLLSVHPLQILLNFFSWCRMVGCVVGYLREYRRWNGKRGLSFDEQRALIRELALEKGYRHCRWQFLKEERNGEERGWPILRKAIQRAEDDADRDLLVVIPTLDGVQFKQSFLRLLLVDDWPIYVCSGWRRATTVNLKDDHERHSKSLGWLLSLSEEAAGFASMVERVGRRALGLSAAIRAGLAKAAARGVPLGSRRRGSHRLTKADQRKGGQSSAELRRGEANAPYRKWVGEMCRWRTQGFSIGQIAKRLADKGVRTPEGRRMGRMLIHRILKRADHVAEG
jgi:hypothetical protein